MTAKEYRIKPGYPTGERHPAHKLTNDQVRSIRAMHLAYITGYGKIAKLFGVGSSTVKDICTYRTWKHVR